MVRPCLVAVVIIVSAGCTGDLSAVNRTPVCAEEPALWTDADYQGLWDASGEPARAALERWERDARCRVYLLRQQASEIAVDAEADVTALKAKAGQMTLKAAQVRDHLEGLLDNNVLAGNVACPTDATDERPQRRDSTTLAKVCVRGEDHTVRLSKLLTTIESHANFSAGDSAAAGVRAHAEHVLNCIQCTTPIDWDGNGDPQQMCGGDLGDYGLTGAGLGDYISLVVADVVDDVVGE